MSFPATITASVSQKTITKVTRLFNGSIHDVVNEMLQNARRAGATKIQITSEFENGAPSGCLVIKDNGRGISDPAKLVTLGDSGWDKDIQASEDPAGMGVFSLAGRKVLVRSYSTTMNRGWQAEISPNAWEGEEPIPVTEAEISEGTEFHVTVPSEWARDIESAVKAASRFYPLPVHFNGHEMDQDDFLAEAVYTVEWNGCRIGVFHNCNNQRQQRLNFHGLLVGHAFPRVKEIGSIYYWNVRVDVIDCPRLKLVLPARKELVQDRFLDELTLETEKIIFQAIQNAGAHALPYKTWKRAIDLGVKLPEASAALKKWEAETGDEESQGGWERDPNYYPISAVCAPLLAGSWNASIQQSIAFAFERYPSAAFEFFQPEAEFRGYTWYDALERVSDFQIIVTRDGEQHEIRVDDAHMNAATEAFQWTGLVDNITIRLEITKGEGSNSSLERREILLKADAVVIDPDTTNCLDEALLFVSRAAQSDPFRVQTLLKDAIFCASDDPDSDSWESQQEDFSREARAMVLELMLDKSEALKAVLTSLIQDEILYKIPKDQNVTITIKRRELNIDILPAEAA